MQSDPFNPVVGMAEALAPDLRRVLAPNASPMTYRGTNTYILGEGAVAVIDPGPASAAHQRAILDALRPGEVISHIFVTHSHIDHSPLARTLSEATGAAIHAYGTSHAGRTSVMTDLAAQGLTGGGEGVDMDFAPHELLADGEIVTAPSWSLQALWTPGHMSNHLCFASGDGVFTGDLVMGWASTMVSPPDGDLSAFMASTQALAERRDRVFYPGHGGEIDTPQERARWLIAHRHSREAEILHHLGTPDAPLSIPALTRLIYTDAPEGLMGAAARNVFAHLIDLHSRGRVDATPLLSLTAYFALR